MLPTQLFVLTPSSSREERENENGKRHDFPKTADQYRKTAFFNIPQASDPLKEYGFQYGFFFRRGHIGSVMFGNREKQVFRAWSRKSFM